MTVTAIVGAQWGDEGKGRIVDYLAQKADMVIRYQGGDNAGHTVMNDKGVFALHLVPSGIFNPHTACIVGTGTVVNPEALLDEMCKLSVAGISLDNLWLSERAHVLMPYHRLLDELEETDRKSAKIGTTKRGIGPAYGDKYARYGIRLADLTRPNYLRTRLATVLERKNAILAQFGHVPLSFEDVMNQALEWGRVLKSRIVDTMPLVYEAIQSEKNVLLEGQLGVMRDIDWGTYPYVTSSNPISGGACAGAGIPPKAIDEVIGVVKAYSTAVGAGPFPTELTDAFGEHLRELGKEYGATTGRPRRCGWFDGVAIKQAAWLNGFTSLAITKLDVLDSIKELKICVGYLVGDRVLVNVPDTPILEQVTPIYETWPGWCETTRGVKTWDELPQAARSYLRRISELAQVEIRYVSVGPEREQLIILNEKEILACR